MGGVFSPFVEGTFPSTGKNFDEHNELQSAQRKQSTWNTESRARTKWPEIGLLHSRQILRVDLDAADDDERSRSGDGGLSLKLNCGTGGLSVFVDSFMTIMLLWRSSCWLIFGGSGDGVCVCVCVMGCVGWGFGGSLVTLLMLMWGLLLSWVSLDGELSGE